VESSSLQTRYRHRSLLTDRAHLDEEGSIVNARFLFDWLAAIFRLTLNGEATTTREPGDVTQRPIAAAQDAVWGFINCRVLLEIARLPEVVWDCSCEEVPAHHLRG